MGTSSLDNESLRKRWLQQFQEYVEADTWGQVEEAIEGYQRLATVMSEQQVGPKLSDTDKNTIGKIVIILNVRAKALRSGGAGVKLEDFKRIKPVIEQLFKGTPVVFPIDLSPYSSEKADLERTRSGVSAVNNIEEDTPHRTASILGGSLLPPPTSKGGTSIVVNIEKIGLKDAEKYIDPFISIMVAGEDGISIEVPQDTPPATKRKPDYILFGQEVFLQTPLERVPQGQAIFLEFRHWKPKKKKKSVRCWSFIEISELKPGPVVLELYAKPTSFQRKKSKLSLFSVKPLYLHLSITLLNS
mmetsp:Transcript_17751/g.29189  ORF Transcript_17751/g.29189 Transcript_17751/m.29189 type:complete len:301 (-) Transcript_17751:641-1543(-)